VQSLTRVRGAERKKIIAKYLKMIDVLILDETHHGSAKSFYRLMQRIQAPFRFGLSGTPFGNADGNGLMVEACFGPVVARVTNEELIQRGVSARPTIRFVEVDKPEIEENLDWHTVYKQGIVLNEHRNQLIAGEAKRFAKANKPCLIMIRELWHGDNLSKLLTEMKVKHAYVHGQMLSANVERSKVKFEAGKFNVLIASPIFGEGVDIPAIRSLIIADGGQSVREVLQKIGRGLRKKDGGDNVLDVVDFADTGHTWLARHSQERMNIYVDEGFEVIAQ
jgi:superfamily II DNA or RNA helicase